MRLRLLLVSAAALLPLAPYAQDAAWTLLSDPVDTFLVDGDRRLSYAPDGGPGVFVSDDGGGTWTGYTEGLPPEEPSTPVYLRGDVAFATTFSGRLFRSSDGGRTWADDTEGLASRRPDDDGSGQRLVDLVRVGDAYLAVTPFGAFRSSGDGPWEAASDGLPPYTETGVDFIAFDAAAVADTVVLASTLGLYRSADGGASWAPSSAGFEVSGLPLGGQAVHALGGRFYALADYPNPFGGVYRSDDGGRTWARRSEGIVMQLRDGPVPGPSNPGGVSQVRAITSVGGALFIGTVGGTGVYRSLDGERWEPFNTGLPKDSEGGYSVPFLWSGPEAGPSAPLFVLANLFPPQASFRVDGAVPTSAGPGPGLGPLAVAAWPNPARSSATVAVTLPASGQARVEVFDALGRRVAVLHDGPASGALRLSADVGVWPAGVYVVRAVTAAGTASGRLVVAR